MDKNKIYETVFETIEASTEWGMGCESKEYGNWIDGVITMANNFLEEIRLEEKTNKIEDDNNTIAE